MQERPQGCSAGRGIDVASRSLSCYARAWRLVLNELNVLNELKELNVLNELKGLNVLKDLKHP